MYRLKKLLKRLFTPMSIMLIPHSGNRTLNIKVPSVDLFSLAKKYNIQVSAAHNALMDSFLTAQLFQRFLCSLPELGVRTVKDLLKIGRP